MPRLRLASLVLLFITALAAAQQNVLVVLADDLGVDLVGAYREGAAPPATPTIDGLAARGVLFRNAWAYPSCSPTRAAILTGRHPSRTMVGRWLPVPNTPPVVGDLPEREWTLPELLRVAGTGHASAAIGKWHLGDALFGAATPQLVGGFDHFTGMLGGQLPAYDLWLRVSNGSAQVATTYATTQQTDDAIAWITAQTGPWFCYLAYNAPHVPTHVPPAHLNARGVTAASSDREKYKAAIEAMDTELGRLLATLGPATIANTHVWFVGDNGTAPGMAEPPFDPFRAKLTPFEGGINVPLIYAGPAATAPGREVAGLACVVDVFASIIDLLSAQRAVPPWLALDGVSLVPHLANPAAPPVRRFAFSEEFVGTAWPAPTQNGVATVRDDRYKLIVLTGTNRQGFFDLQSDPFENQNLANGPLPPAMRQARAALLEELDRIRSPGPRSMSFGTSSCLGSAGTPRLSAGAAARIGGALRLDLADAAANTLAIMAVGLSHLQSSGTPLPRDLQPLGAGPGCMQWISHEVIVATPTDARGAAVFTLPIPPQGALVETTLLCDWLVLDPGAPGNPIGLVTTAPLAVIVGT